MTAALRAALLAAALFAVAPAAHAAAPLPKPNYVSFQVEGFRSTGPVSSTLTGLSVDWGFFQNRFVATGTRIAAQRDVADGLGTALMILAGPQFHVPLGEQLLLIPALNLGVRLGQRMVDYAAYFDLAFAYRQDDLYLGLAGQTPVFLQQQLFPSIYSANLIVGFYY